MQGRPLHIAMPITEYFCPGIFQAGKRIISRNTSIIMQADDRTGMIIQFLRPVTVSPVTQRNVKIALLIKYQPGTKVTA